MTYTTYIGNDSLAVFLYIAIETIDTATTIKNTINFITFSPLSRRLSGLPLLLFCVILSLE
jgi:hypothetical protein